MVESLQVVGMFFEILNVLTLRANQSLFKNNSRLKSSGQEQTQPKGRCKTDHTIFYFVPFKKILAFT